MHTALITLTTLLTTTLASPITSSQATQEISTGLTVIRPNSPIHHRAINATGRGFWIGRPTTTFCPYDPPYQLCNYPNTTAIDIYPPSSDYQAYMYANVAGGQNVYVGPTGALLFTLAHEEYIFPNGSYTRGFNVEKDDRQRSFLTFTNGSATAWYACPAFKQKITPYRVYANVEGFGDSAVPTGHVSDCLEFQMMIANPKGLADLTAWQYE